MLAEYARHYNGHRPHQVLRQEAPLRQPGSVVDITARIEHRSVVGGLTSEAVIGPPFRRECAGGEDQPALVSVTSAGTRPPMPLEWLLEKYLPLQLTPADPGHAEWALWQSVRMSRWPAVEPGSVTA